MKIKARKILEITEDDVKSLKLGDNPLLACGTLEMKAAIIIFNGRVLKNKHGNIFPMNSPEMTSMASHVREQKAVLLSGGISK